LRHLSRVLLVCTLLAGGAHALAQTLTVDWYTVDGGGDMWASGGNFELSGTIGQHDTDGTLTMTGTTLSLTGGFWAGAATTASVPGDCDGNGWIDFDDFDGFAACMAGPDVGLVSGCECADVDGDHDGDLADFAAFQRVFAPQ